MLSVMSVSTEWHPGDELSATSTRGRLLGRQVHVGAAPADEEIHPVHDGVFIGLAAGQSQMLSSALEKLENGLAGLTGRQEMQGQVSKFIDWIASSEGLFDALVHYRPCLPSSGLDQVFCHKRWVCATARWYSASVMDRLGSTNP